ncbi:MAG: PQQ-binding-like beta-propeller repeat protein [Planctomycetota bacterium]|nr:PQQ-binding-like beta-propeller repeat protein [Planctomycetota bacterium]
MNPFRQVRKPKSPPERPFGRAGVKSVATILIYIGITALICSLVPSCQIFNRFATLTARKDKKLSSVKDTGAEELSSGDIKRLEYYRDYINKKLPFKKILWEAVFKGERIRQIHRYGDSVYVETSANRIYSISADTGFRQWQVQLPAPIDFAISTAGDLPKKEASLGKALSSIEKEIADETRRKEKDQEKINLLKRQFQAMKEEFFSLRQSDAIYFTCRGTLYCLDRLSGNILWQSRLRFVPGTTPCSTIIAVFIGALDFYKVFQIDTSLKYDKNRFNADEPINTTPLYEIPILYFASAGGKIYAYDTISGKLLWSYQTEKSIKTDMLMDEDILYVGGTDFTVYALDRYAGILLWKFETGSSITTPMRLDKRVILSRPGGTKPPESSPEEETKLEGGGEESDKPRGEEKKETTETILFVYGDKKGLYALDVLTEFLTIKDEGSFERERTRVIKRAKPRWNFEKARHFLVSGQQDIYVIGTDNITLYALSSEKEGGVVKIKGKYDLSLFPVRYGDLIPPWRNTVYLGTSEGYLFSVRE